MEKSDRITLDPDVMGAKSCIRGLRATVGTILRLLASGRSAEEILKAYPSLEAEDIAAAFQYAAWQVEDRGVDFARQEGPSLIKKINLRFENNLDPHNPRQSSDLRLFPHHRLSRK